MKVLDAFCGMGGWSFPFVEAGDFVVGVDIANYGYPGKLILQDIRTLDGTKFRGFDFIVGSPPCRDFSTATQANKGYPRRLPPDPQRGLELIYHFERIVAEARPKFWAMENVSRLEKFYDVKPIWRFKVSVRGRRSLWGNIPLGMVPDITFKRKLAKDYVNFRYEERSALRSKIPYPIARIIADCVREAGETAAEGWPFPSPP